MHPDIPILDENPPRSGLVRGVLVIVTAVAIGAFVITQGLDNPTIEAVASAEEEVGAADDGDGGGGDAAIGSEVSPTTTTVLATTIESTASTEAPVETTPTSAAAPAILAAGEVSVLVLNGAGTRGIAGEGASILQDLGYDVLAPKNANAIGPSQVLYLDGFEAEAQAVAAAFGVDPAAVVAPLDPAAPPFEDLGSAIVIVVIGEDGVIGV